ncbi:MAG: hypothetical protein K2Q10_03815, partial [Rhodospirillales bacterium]|nr:hypothetical protein [Rhodospirillales bacterium]
FNREAEETLLFQIWIETARRNAEPRWDTRRFPGAGRAGKLVALASGRNGDDALRINQDAAVLGAHLDAGQTVVHALGTRRAYLVPAKGIVLVNDVRIPARDGAAISGEESVVIEAVEDAELVLVDVP